MIMITIMIVILIAMQKYNYVNDINNDNFF